MIEDKLRISRFLSWTFCSCTLGKFIPYMLSLTLTHTECTLNVNSVRNEAPIFPLSGKRKPELDFYSDVVRHLEVDPSNCIFIDDRLLHILTSTYSSILCSFTPILLGRIGQDIITKKKAVKVSVETLVFILVDLNSKIIARLQYE